MRAPHMNQHGRSLSEAAPYERTSTSRAGPIGNRCGQSSLLGTGRLRVDLKDLVLQPLRNKAVVGVDVDLAQGSGAAVGELVRDTGRGDNDLTTLHLDRVLIDGQGGLSLLDDEDLGVRVTVQAGPAAGRTIEQNHA